jgi:ribosome-binding protein aMBF1 (putative translation factor)
MRGAARRCVESKTMKKKAGTFKKDWKMTHAQKIADSSGPAPTGNDRRPKLSDDEVDRLRVMHEEDGWGYRRLARHFDTPRDTVRSLCKYRRR